MMTQMLNMLLHLRKGNLWNTITMWDCKVKIKGKAVPVLN